jgi:hypothetical protein
MTYLLSTGRALALILCVGAAFAGPLTYTPVGPQTGVALSTVTGGGWTQCYAAAMNVPIGNNAENVLSGCQGDYLMMAGRVAGSDTLLVLAEAPYADVTFDTGSTDRTTVHVANGSAWYFAPYWSWGFAGIGDNVDKYSCDIQGGTNKMCLHTYDSVGGYRIGNIMELNSNVDYEKIFFVANDVAGVPEPATATLLTLGIAAFLAARTRRRV